MWVLKHHSCRVFSKTLLTHQIKAKMVPSCCAPKHNNEEMLQFEPKCVGAGEVMPPTKLDCTE